MFKPLNHSSNIYHLFRLQYFFCSSIDIFNQSVIQLFIQTFFYPPSFSSIHPSIFTSLGLSIKHFSRLSIIIYLQIQLSLNIYPFIFLFLSPSILPFSFFFFLSTTFCPFFFSPLTPTIHFSTFYSSASHINPFRNA